MQDFAETLLNTVAALSAASFGYFGVTLKDDQTRASRPVPAVVRKVPAPRPELAMRSARLAIEAPCDDPPVVRA